MRAPALNALQAGDTLARALDVSRSTSEDVLLVRFPTGRWAELSRDSLPEFEAKHPPETLLRELLSTARLPVLHPYQRLDDALRFIQGHALLPVVSREGSRKLEGVISLADILAAYQRAT